MQMKAYISGTGNISPQKTYDSEAFLNEIEFPVGQRFTCIEPDYEPLIESRLLRRMSRILRMSWSAAKICLDDAKVQMPDAIVTGTGLGCIEDTEKFLTAIYDSHERLLPPTPFIQSTHNTIGAQIALMLQCTNYNMTYTQRGASFESALIDSISLISDPGFNQVLVGGFDEMTSKQMIFYNRLNYYKKEFKGFADFLNSNTQGTIAGEGNTFFFITKDNRENSYSGIKDVTVFSFPENNDVIHRQIGMFLEKNNLSSTELDLLILGVNGDKTFDGIYDEVSNRIFQNVPVAYFKHLCGEYHTASAFALWLGANILKRQFLPEVVSKNNEIPKSFKNILIYNQYRNINHSLILLSAC
jgi:3-oxoacyl-[acyl-carrier-protein] synthase II